jgi:FtsP/CotA-like multicopper oxidase with cupredoxin domain
MRTMISNAVRLSCLLTILVVASSVLCAADRLPTIAANDNRSRAGGLHDGVLTMRLELGEGQWHPESEDGEALTVYALGEAGQPLQIPGPLIRVSQGTEVQAIVHNALPVPATVHGLHERPGNENDGFLLQPGATREVRFNAGAPGSYYYWATTTGSPIERRTPIETQLAGAFIIDPPGAVVTDRVFVISVWYKGVRFTPNIEEVATINGKSWPYTERFTFQVGETVRWRWLNPSIFEHAMHLHGFYYHLDSVGDGEHHQAFSEAQRPPVVTKLVESGETFDMTWVPERAGRWLFHCHMLVHMLLPARRMTSEQSEQGDGTLPSSRPASANRPAAAYEHPHGEEADRAGMAGLVLGITVVGEKEGSNSTVWRPERKLQLTINEREDGGRPLYALQVRDLAQPPSPSPQRATPLLIGPPIVLTRGQPIEIEVVNRSKQPTAIHWHGIELESYYDGVAGWTGTTQQTTPAIQPGESFVARMAPPRAGTFIYHTHWHDRAQLENGIYGPLIVLPPGQEFDPSSDKTFLFSLGVFEPFGPMLLINGRPQPLALQLATGTKYRFRLINIAPDQARMRASLRRAGTPVQWRIIAKDGTDLPPSAATMQAAELAVTVGETYDFEYEASAPQELALEVYLPGLKARATQALVFSANRPNN